MVQPRDFQWGGQFSRNRLLYALGVEGQKLPREHNVRAYLGDGLTVFIKPAGEKRQRGAAKHRLYIHCSCGREITSGCMAQHLRHSKEHNA